MKTNFNYNVLYASVLALALVGCGGDDNKTTVSDPTQPTQPSNPTPILSAVTSSQDVAVYGDYDPNKFSEITLDDGSPVIILNDDSTNASYAGMGLKLPDAASNAATLVTPNKVTTLNYAASADELRDNAEAFKSLIESALINEGAVVNVLVDQSSVNAQSTVVRYTLSVDFDNTVQSPSYVRNLALATLNNGVVPSNIPVIADEAGDKILLDLSFWQDGGLYYLWTGSSLAKDATTINGKYGDLKSASALTSNKAFKKSNKAFTPIPAQAQFTQGNGTTGGIDILWSIDASGSMGEEQANLANGAEQFFNTLQAAGVDYRLAVNSQGKDDSNFSCSTLRETTDGASFIDNQTIDALDKWKALAKLGTSDASTETGFYCTREVDLTGFDRPNVKNITVFVSDEPENETFRENSPAAADFTYQNRDYANYEQYFLNTGTTYFAIAGTATSVRNTFNDSVDTGNDPNYNCQGEGGGASGGAHFKEIAKQTGGSSASICADAADWSVMFDRILETATGLASEFTLVDTPIPSTVAVKVDGIEIMRDTTHTNGFDIIYGQNTASIVFYGNAKPAQGSKIDIDYVHLFFKPNINF